MKRFALFFLTVVFIETFAGQSYKELVETLAKNSGKKGGAELIPTFRELEFYSEYPHQKNICYLNLALAYKAIKKQDSVIHYIGKVTQFDLLTEIHFASMKLNAEDLLNYVDFSSKEWQMINSKRIQPIISESHSKFEEIKFHFEDINNFWLAFDKGVQDSFARRKLMREYLESLSYPSKCFFANGFSDSKYFTDYIFNRRKYFSCIRTRTLNLDSSFYHHLKVALDKAKPFFKSACYNDIYFTIGTMHDPIAMFETGVLVVPINFYALDDKTNLEELTIYEQRITKSINYLPACIIHELTHPNQNLSASNYLLSEAISEGMADYFAEYFTGLYLREYVTTWTQGKVRYWWNKFKIAEYKTKDTTFFPFVLEEITENHPIHISTYFGYQICKKYVSNKSNGLQKLLREKRSRAILLESLWEQYVSTLSL